MNLLSILAAIGLLCNSALASSLTKAYQNAASPLGNLSWQPAGSYPQGGLLLSETSREVSGDLPTGVSSGEIRNVVFRDDSPSHCHSAVPEPASMLLIGLGLIGVGMVGKRIRR